MAPETFVQFIVKSIVAHPEDVSIEKSLDEKGVLIQLIVHKEDIGRVIGQRGQIAQSIRTLLRALAYHNDARYALKVIDVDKLEEA